MYYREWIWAIEILCFCVCVQWRHFLGENGFIRKSENLNLGRVSSMFVIAIRSITLDFHEISTNLFSNDIYVRIMSSPLWYKDSQYCSWIENRNITKQNKTEIFTVLEFYECSLLYNLL